MGYKLICTWRQKVYYEKLAIVFLGKAIAFNQLETKRILSVAKNIEINSKIEQHQFVQATKIESIILKENCIEIYVDDDYYSLYPINDKFNIYSEKEHVIIIGRNCHIKIAI